jgi:hypothetical protein
MRSVLSAVILALALGTAAPAAAGGDAPSKQTAPAEKCEHGVKKALCARCNPKLIPVYKAKGDWCEEHKRPESQCVLCKPQLAKEGVK